MDSIQWIQPVHTMMPGLVLQPNGQGVLRFSRGPFCPKYEHLRIPQAVCVSALMRSSQSGKAQFFLFFRIVMTTTCARGFPFSDRLLGFLSIGLQGPYPVC